MNLLKSLFSRGPRPVRNIEAVEPAVECSIGRPCAACLDAELPRIPVTVQSPAFASRLIDATSFGDPVTAFSPITQYAPEVFVWYDEAGLMAGVEYSFNLARAAQTRYMARLNMPVAGYDVQIAELMDALHLETERADNAGRNASAFENRMCDLQVKCGSLEDDLAEYREIVTSLRSVRDQCAQLGGVNKRLRSKLRVARNTRNQLRAKLADVQQGFNTACDDKAMWAGQLVEVARRYKAGTLNETAINEALNGELYAGE